MDLETWQPVYDFWFPPGLENCDRDQHARMGPWWFAGGASGELPAYAPFLEAAAEGDLDHWLETPQGRLCLIVVLDQFPRGLHAGTPQAYSFDPLALRLAEEGIANGQYEAMRYPWEKLFFQMPLTHAEGPDHLDRLRRVLTMTEAMVRTAPPSLAPFYEFAVGQARGNLEVITTFGRFPHRNETLGRASSPEELAYVSKGEFVHTRRPPA